MEKARILIALEAMIEQYALNSFASNGVSAEEAAIAMEAVSGRFQKRAHDETIMSMVASIEPDVTVTQKEPVVVRATGEAEQERDPLAKSEVGNV